ncbi:hypothetical protein V8C86DRAFT_10798 [Haematococcus lacustris]
MCIVVLCCASLLSACVSPHMPAHPEIYTCAPSLYHYTHCCCRELESMQGQCTYFGHSGCCAVHIQFLVVQLSLSKRSFVKSIPPKHVAW